MSLKRLFQYSELASWIYFLWSNLLPALACLVWRPGVFIELTLLEGSLMVTWGVMELGMLWNLVRL